MKIFSCLTVAVGILLLLIAAATFLFEMNYLRRAQLVVGTVTELYRSLSVDSDGYTYCPVFEFSTQDGGKIKYRANVCASPPAYKVGDQRELYYDPNNTKHVQMNNFWSKYTAPFVFGVIGGVFFLFGLISFIPGVLSPKPRKGPRTPNQLG
jgi:hypothetical protein